MLAPRTSVKYKQNCFISIVQNSQEKNLPRKSSGSIINLVWGRDWKLEFDLLRWERSWVRVSEGYWSEGAEERRHFLFVIRPSSWVQCVFSNLMLISCSDKEMRVQQQHRTDLSHSFLLCHVLRSSHACNMFHPERGIHCKLENPVPHGSVCVVVKTIYS